MKKIFVVIPLALAGLFVATSAAAIEAADVIGSWRYVSFMYHGAVQALPHPDLALIFKFDDKGVETISWTYENQPGFCEETGNYSVANNQLMSEITAINPNNNASCAQDPDMQLGKKSTDPIDLRDGQIFLNIGLSGEDFFYIFDKVEDQTSPKVFANQSK